MTQARRERIALISSSYHPYPGGVEEHTRNVARELRHLGHEVVVWTVDRGERLGVQSVDDIEVRYLPTPLPAGNPAAVLRFTGALPGAWLSWMRALRDFSPDVLHVQCFGPNGLYALALHRRTGIPLMVSSHGETFADERNVFQHSWLLRKGLQEAVRAASAVTGCSDIVLEDLRARFGLTGGVVVPNGVDLAELARFNPVSRERAGDEPATLFAVGRAVHVKGFDLLVKAFAEADIPRPARLVIGGDGPEIPALLSLVDELGLAGQVELPGRLTREQVVRGLAEADVVVVPSRVEAFGIVVLEAWRSGKALVAPDRGGPSGLVRDEVDGLLVDPEDTQALAGAIARLLGDGELRRRLGEQGLQSVKAFTWARSAKEYDSLYGRP